MRPLGSHMHNKMSPRGKCISAHLRQKEQWQRESHIIGILIILINYHPEWNKIRKNLSAELVEQYRDCTEDGRLLFVKGRSSPKCPYSDLHKLDGEVKQWCSEHIGRATGKKFLEITVGRKKGATSLMTN